MKIEPGSVRRVISEYQDAKSFLYQGGIFLLPKSRQSMALVSMVEDLLGETFSHVDPRMSHRFFKKRDFFEAFGAVRRQIYCHKEFHEGIEQLLSAYGWNNPSTVFDPLRMRIVTPDGHRSAEAAPVYYGHRDTWYGNPQSMVTWWIALHDVEAGDTFEFYPRFFGKPVANDSHAFNYADWIKDGPNLKIGWQDPDSGRSALYPQLQESIDEDEPRTRLLIRRGEVMLFSGQRLHKTLPNQREKIRLSLDFRTANLLDEAKDQGALNVDNHSRGSSIKDYRHVLP